MCSSDLDGDEDVVVLNGHLERYSSYHDQRPQLLENSDGNRFALAALDSEFFRTPQSGRGLATADFDRDGLIDLVVSRIQAPCGIIRNESEPQGAFLEVRLVGTSSNRDAIGAVATLMIGELASDDTASDTRASGDLKIGNSKWIRQIVGGGSYASTCDPALHFGIPSRIAEQLKAGKKRSVGAPLLRIDWPSGKTTEHAVDALDRQILIIEEDPNGPMSIPPIEINPAK